MSRPRATERVRRRDSASLPELWLVKGESVTFHLYSPDVIHSFWVPAFYFKIDVIPGRSDRTHRSR